ncbi:CASP-like protein 5A1 [Cynara cardunculus var. scolymus]|uniref:CASP-like protein 5A1 n=1 Tax=Cynara cardunculus var. scolymus TaxID=59895 RepID=UPI000D624412|nr:CASP-like protein 5A1 [Cynara cardunculus var. scolymus]
MSNRSRPSVHPLDTEVPQLREGAAADNGDPPDDTVIMKDVQGMPGTPAGLILRLFQFGFAAVSVAVMAATSDFPSVTAFRYLVAALSLQCLWSLSLAILDIYALLVKRCLRNARVLGSVAIGDGITSTLTFAAACASAGITVLIGSDLNNCAENHCTRFETSIAMAFVSWFLVSPTFFLSFWSLASR